MTVRLENVEFAHPEGPTMRFDLAVPAGSFALLTGPSGSGKSTLLALLAGFETPATGRVLLDGRDCTALDPADRPVTMVFQEHNLFAGVDALTNVALGVAPDRRIKRADRDAAERSLARVGLAGFGPRLPGTLSGGERQRVALARAALRDRPVLLLDEPFAALGPALRADMLGLLASIAAERGATVLMVTHDPLEALPTADLAVVLAEGAVHAIGPADILLSDDPVIRAYLGPTSGRGAQGDEMRGRDTLAPQSEGTRP